MERSDVASYLHEVYPQADVVAFHYRGYRPSTGSPSAKALLADAPLVFDAAFEHVKPDRAVVAGFSIGSGVAASLASRRPAQGFILVTPFEFAKEGRRAKLTLAANRLAVPARDRCRGVS